MTLNQKFSRRTLLNLAYSGLLLNMLGCSETPPLRIAAHIWPGYELMFLAEREGWLPKDKIQLLNTTSATDSIQALIEGRADGAALTLDEVLRARTKNIDLTIVLIFDISSGADVLLSKKPIKNLSDLKNKRIGVENNALGLLILDVILDYLHLTKKDIQLVPVPINQHYSTWQYAEIDALITYEPIASQLEKLGAERVIDSRSFPELIFDVLAVRKEKAEQYKLTLKQLISGHFKALNHLQRNPQDASYRMAEHLKIPGEEVLDSFRGLIIPDLSANLKRLAPNSHLLEFAAKDIVKILNEDDLLKHPNLFEHLTSTEYLPHI
jgi:NitT/TauT family transport system substrate-binding protein